MPDPTRDPDSRFVLQVIQPALLGLMDGSVSTLAPLFAAAALTGKPREAFIVGMASSIGAGISMGLAEALSDDGATTGRGHPWGRGAITGAATILGGTMHTLPFLIPSLQLALTMAYVIVAAELVVIAYIRYRFMKSPLGSTVVQVLLGGALVFFTGLWMGSWGGAG